MPLESAPAAGRRRRLRPAHGGLRADLALPARGVHRALVNELSGDRAFEYDRHLTHYHRTGGSRDFFAAAEYIRQAAAAAGLEDVKLVRQKWDEHGWSCRSGEAWLIEPEEVKLAAYGEVAVSIADHSRTTHVIAELVDVGAGTAADDYKGREVRGKVVLASGPVAAAHAGGGLEARRAGRPVPRDQPARARGRARPGGLGPAALRGAQASRASRTARPATFAVMISPAARALAPDSALAAGGQAAEGQGGHRGGVPGRPGAGLRRGLDQGHGDPRPADRAHRAHPGGDDLRQRRRQRLRQPPGDGPRAHPPDRATASCRAPARHPVLVGERAGQPAAVLPGEPARAAAHARQHQPGHGGGAAEPGRPRAIRLAPSLEPAPRPRRRHGERAHHGARRQHLAPHPARHAGCRSRSRARCWP